MTLTQLSFIAALALVVTTGCDAMDVGGAPGRRKGAAAGGDDAGEVTTAPSPPPEKVGGATVPPVEGGPGIEQPAEPGGYKEAIAPLMSASGCLECHHAGRPIDLARYPFMAGAKDETADRLVRSLETTMPPSPRAKVDGAVVARIQKWRQEGMKP